MPPGWMDEVIRALWESMGPTSPFCVQAEAPMHLVHLLLAAHAERCLVTDKGKFVGMINKVDMQNAF